MRSRRAACRVDGGSPEIHDKANPQGTMHRLKTLLFAAAVASGAWPAQAQTATGTVSHQEKEVGPARSIAFDNGTTARLRTSRTQTPGRLSSAQCGVEIGGQSIATIGAGDLDAYTCDHLVEAGALPSAADVRRVGLIYAVSSPNAHFRTALVLVETGTIWRLDPASLGKWDDTPAARSLGSLAAALKRRR